MRTPLRCLFAGWVWLVAMAVCGGEKTDAPSDLSGGFEDGREAWLPTAVGSIDSQETHSGKASLRVVDADAEKYGATGTRQWFCYLGDAGRMLWPQQDGAVLALCASGEALRVSGEGKLVGREDMGSPITALLRPGEHRAEPSVLPVGTEDGVLRILPR